MELDYEINRLYLSLKEVCALRVARLLLEAKNFASEGALTAQRDIEYEAKASTLKLEAPESVQGLVEIFIDPIADELAFWYRSLRMSSKPTLTQQGTLDIVNSAKDVLADNKVDTYKRFLLACCICSEKHIYELGRQLSSSERSQIQSQTGQEASFDIEDVKRYGSLLTFQLLGKHWLEAYSDRVDEQFDGVDLPQKTYHDMLRVALKHGKDVTIRFFLKKAKVRRIPKEHLFPLSTSLCTAQELKYSPATLCCMLSLVDNEERSAAEVQLSFSLLRSLTNWPYQRFFMDAAPPLVGNLTQCQVWRILFFIIQKRMMTYEDCNYQEMFIAFFRLVADQLKGASFDNCCGLQVAYMVFSCNDYLILTFFLDQISDKDKKDFLLGFEDNGICANLLINRRYKELELFVGGCAMSQRTLLVKFKEECLARFPKCPERTRFRKVDNPLSDNEWAAVLRKVGEIVDKIIANECSDEEAEE